jgi:DNA polymerase-3 subunit beta
MRFTAKTDTLKEAINITSHASLGTSMTPILENILINVGFKKVIFTANNLEMAIEYVLDKDVEIQTEGSFTASSRFLSSYIGLLQDEQIHVELLSNSSIRLSTQSSDMRVMGIEPEKFPLIPAIKTGESIRIPIADFREAISKTLFSTAEGNIRPTLAGIYFTIKENKIIFASTDSFRLSEFVVPTQAGAPLKTPAIIIPAKTATELGRILPENGEVELFVSDNQLLIVFGNIKVYSRLLNGHFPEYPNFFPKTFTTKGVALKSELVSALKQANLISRENNYNTRLAFSAQSGLEVSTGDTEIGAGSVRVAASVEGEDAIVGLNSAYLLDVLNVIKEDHVSIAFNTNLGPILIEGV